MCQSVILGGVALVPEAFRCIADAGYLFGGTRDVEGAEAKARPDQRFVLRQFRALKAGFTPD